MMEPELHVLGPITWFRITRTRGDQMASPRKPLLSRALLEEPSGLGLE
jgi:hypothetical protein